MNRFAVRDDISFTNEGGVGLFKESLATIEIILIIKPEPPRAPGPGHPILWMCEVVDSVPSHTRPTVKLFIISMIFNRLVQSLSP